MLRIRRQSDMNLDAVMLRTGEHMLVGKLGRAMQLCERDETHRDQRQSTAVDQRPSAPGPNPRAQVTRPSRLRRNDQTRLD